MNIKNFDENRSVRFYTTLHLDDNTIYSDDFQTKELVEKNNSIYIVLNVKFQNNEEYWEIKSLNEKNSLGWVKAKEHLKILNVIPQKVQINSSYINRNVSGYTEEFNTNILYSKRFITLINDTIFFGLYYEEEFIGFVNLDDLNFGEIEPIRFKFQNEEANIYSQPDLKHSNKFNHFNEEYFITKYFSTPDFRSAGFNFGENTYWLDVNDIEINLENVRKIQTYDLNIIKNEYYLNCIRASDTEYYSINKKFNTTSKLNKIIENFESIDSAPSFYTPFNVKIGIICDEFMYYSLKDSANIEYIPYSDDIKLNKKYDLILVVSSWRGIDDSWQYIANPKGKKRQVLHNLLNQYNEANIPTVFYSKEDPVNYERFISIAEHCEYIYTSAEEIIDQYKNETGNNNVDYLQFSINPSYHNPMGKDLTRKDIQDQVVFAGSWMKKYPIRNEESRNIFDGVIESNNQLNIVDRNFDRVLYDYQFPYNYVPYISQTIDHENLMKLHKATTWGINLNSVKYSNTMFANRVYELQAMGNLIISNYSMGVNNKFPYVSMVYNKEDVIRTINSTEQKDKLEVISKGITNVMLNHTAFHRIDKILSNIGYKTELPNPSILVIGLGPNAKISFDQQYYKNRKFLYEYEINENHLNGNYDYIAYFHDEYIYEENYLRNLLSTFAYTDADIIEMSDRNVYAYKTEETFNKYTSLVTAGKNKVESKVFNIPMTELEENRKLNFNEYTNKKLSVIIPIHNNGRYLEDKCFRSLKRSSIFKNMEIIMIDDGSTDEETLKIISRLRRRHPDIIYYRFDNGSGSASRPRNKGIELVKTKYLTFLDPDNEASGDGYNKLLTELEENSELDLVLGNVLKEDNSKQSLLNYYYYALINNNGMDIISNPKEFLIEVNLRAHSIQALVVKSAILKDNNLKMIEGAAGQDTMFFQELILHTHKFKTISDIIHIYYAAVDGSVTTTIKKSFFEKYLVLEKERVPFLKKNDLFEIYVNNRFPYYFTNWYIKKLAQVQNEEYDEIVNILFDIYHMYSAKYNGHDDKFNMTINELFNSKIK